MVKLKPAKQYLRDFYLIRDGADAYQENDILMGVSYLYALAREYSMPLVVCIALGTNMGSHMGTSRLGQYLNQVSLSNGSAVITAAGNETGARHHFQAVMNADTDEITAELRVGEQETGFSMELWANEVGVYTVGFISPTGEVAKEIPVPLRGENTLSFLLEQTQITVYTQIADVSAGSQFIFMRFERPMSGIWRIRSGTLWTSGKPFISGFRYGVSSRMRLIFSARIPTRPSQIPEMPSIPSPSQPMTTRGTVSTSMPAAVTAVPGRSSRISLLRASIF